jgi:hypothetical protein
MVENCNPTGPPVRRASPQVWSEKEQLPTGYGAATLAEWAALQGAAPKASQ